MDFSGFIHNVKQGGRIVLLLGIIILVTTSARAQSGCPGWSNYYSGFAKCTYVYYQFVNFFEPQRDQMRAAFSSWTSANAGIDNFSQVVFIEGTPPAGSVSAYSLSIESGTPARNPNAVSEFQNLLNGNFRIVLNLRATVLSQGQQVPVYDSSDTNNYLPFFTKVLLHEVGHGMGLDDVFPPNPPSLVGPCGYESANSVMHQACGPDDRGGALAS